MVTIHKIGSHLYRRVCDLPKTHEILVALPEGTRLGQTSWDDGSGVRYTALRLLKVEEG